jgi:DNA-binding PucR family transcriptional regulator
MRYRVRRAVEISGISLDDPVERLLTELQLRQYPSNG